MQRFLLVFVIVLFCINTGAQVPPGFSYQAIIRNDSGEPISLKSVSFRFSILTGSIDGAELYVETQSATTNTFGLVNITIGEGTAETGVFDPGGWGSENHYLKVEIDPEGGNIFELMGLQKLQSVPYAFHAQTVAEDKVEDADADPANEIQDLQISGTVLSLSGSSKTVILPSSGGGADNWGTQTVVSDESLSGEGTTAAPLSVDQSKIKSSWLNITEIPEGFADGTDNVEDADSDVTNELQSLSKEGNLVSLSGNGGSFIDEVKDDDADITNELQLLTKSGNLISLSHGGGSVTDEVEDDDADITNELQTLTKTGNTIILSAGGGSVIDEVEDSDADPENELQSLSKSGNTLSLSGGGGSVVLEFEELDGDVTNELQTLSKSGSQITLSNGGGTVTDEVEDNDADITNEIQILTKTGNTISLSNGGGSVSDETEDLDADPLNELQTLSLSENSLSLNKGGGTVELPVSAGGDDWGTQAVVSNSTLTGNGTSGSPLAVVGDLSDDQTLSLSGNDLSILGGNTVTLPEAPSGLWSENGANVYRSSGSVGIGTSNPVNNLHIKASSIFSGISFTNDASGNTDSDGLVIGSAYQQGEPGNCYALINNMENSPIIFSTSGVARMYLNSSGNLGIGTYPANRLDINGQIRIRGGNPGSGKVLTSDVDGLASWEESTASITLPFEASATVNDDDAFCIVNHGSDDAIKGYSASTTGTNSGVFGWSESTSGRGVYGLVTATYGDTRGVYGHVTSSGGTAVYGFAQASSGPNYGVKGVTNSSGGFAVSGSANSSSGACIAVKGNCLSNEGFSGYFSGGSFYINGNTGIGTATPTYKLDVHGNSRIQLTKSNGDWLAMRTDGSLLDFSFSGDNLVIRGSADGENIILNPAINSKVGIRMWIPQYDLDVNGDIRATGSVYYGGSTSAADGTSYNKPDYVFENNYETLTISEVKQFLENEKHLPWITSAEREKEENGEVVDMTRMAFETVETIENLQLQIIELNEQLQIMQERIDNQQAQIIQLKNQNQNK